MAGDIFVISDLHLGDGGPRDNFEVGNRTRELRAFIDHVGSEQGQLFILGDLFELWQMNFSRMMLKRKEILDHFTSIDMTYVPGNHDDDLKHFVGDTDFLAHPFFARMRAPFTRMMGGRRYHFSHGHETDPFNASDQPGYGRMLTIFAGVFEDQNGSPILPTGEVVEEMLTRFGESMLTIWRLALASFTRLKTGSASPTNALTPAQNPDRLVEHVDGIRRALLEEGGHDVAVLGHTHKPGRIGDWYFNSGSWVTNKNQFLRISPDGHVRYLEWHQARAEEHAMPLVMPEVEPSEAKTKQNPVQTAMSTVKTIFPTLEKPSRKRAALFAEGALALGVAAAVLFVTRDLGVRAGLRVLVIAFAAYSILDGLLSIALASREAPLRRAFSWARGIGNLVLGAVVLRRGQGIDALALLVGAYAVASGALRVAAALLFEEILESRAMLWVGAGSMIAGLALFFLPTQVALFKYAIVAYLVYWGFGQILAGIAPRRSAKTERAIAKSDETHWGDHRRLSGA